MQLNESKVPQYNRFNKGFLNPYVPLLQLQSDWVFEEETAKEQRGFWRENIFRTQAPLHVEIGTGNGFHFAHYAESYPQLNVLGFEIKFKTTVQSIERARSTGATNARMIKGDARILSDYFADGEVDKIIIHFPDPWPKRRQQKNRLIQPAFLKEMERVLKPGGWVEFKTDHPGYFQHATKCAAESSLILKHYTEDLHHSFLASNNYVTMFEDLFLRKGQPIYSFLLQKTSVVSSIP